MDKITLSINPYYFCNFACNFCYLTPEQLDDSTLLPINVLRQRLTEVSQVYKVEKVDLYGGEIGLLPQAYIDDLKLVLLEFDITDINIITNLSMLNSIVLDPAFYLSVSYDFDCREKDVLVFANMLMIPKPFAVLMLASPCLIEKNVDEMIQMLNLIGNIESVEIKPYSSNQANQLDVRYDQFEEFVKRWIESPIEKSFTLTNEYMIKETIIGKRNSFSDDHLYITPTGKFGVLEFDLNDNEFFLELDSVEQYGDWTITERERVDKNEFCSTCEYFGKCLSEHLREVKSLDHSCNGFKLLVDWYKDRALPQWKLRQEYYHLNTTDYRDDLNKFDIEISDDIVDNALRYFNERDIGWIYPAKSYAVGICYAAWLDVHFDVNFYDALNDPDLLYGNDPYFVPYDQDSDTYDKIIRQLESRWHAGNKGMVPDIRQYFLEEFMIDEI